MTKPSRRDEVVSEDQWTACPSPLWMLERLRGQVSNRKLRLYACACCRLLRRASLEEPRCREAVEVAEQYADGQANAEELERAKDRALGTIGWYVAWENDWYTAHATVRTLIQFQQESRLADLLRCLVDRVPLRPLSLPGTILQWNQGAVVSLARSIYHDRRFEDLPILADALEEAGFDRSELLEHIREPGDHARGCWALDLLLKAPG